MPVNLKLIVALVVGLVAGSCTTYVLVHDVSTPVAPGAQFVARTMSYYEAHLDEARARAAACLDQGITGIANTPQDRDCNAARSASFGGQRK